MFLGTHTPRLDEKGRLFLPAKYREELAGGLVITKGQERCLYVFPEAEFGRECCDARPRAAQSAPPGAQVFGEVFTRTRPRRLTSLPRCQAAQAATVADEDLAGRRVVRVDGWYGWHRWHRW